MGRTGEDHCDFSLAFSLFFWVAFPFLWHITSLLSERSFIGNRITTFPLDRTFRALRNMLQDPALFRPLISF